MGVTNQTPELFLGVVKQNKMKLTDFLLIGLMFLSTMIISVMSHYRTIEEIQELGVNQEKIDSLQREIDFRDDMIQHYIEDQEADMVYYRIKAQEK